MDRSDDLNRRTLQRIVALLLALAGLAEAAAGRCRPVRWAVLWLLSPGEKVARDHVMALTGHRGLAPPPEPLAGLRVADGAADALRLARAFRALAAVLSALVQSLGVPLQPELAAAALAALARAAARAVASLRAIAPDRRDSS